MDVDQISKHFPFTKFFENAPQSIFKGHRYDQDLEIAHGCFRHIKKIFAQLEVSQYSTRGHSVCNMRSISAQCKVSQCTSRGQYIYCGRSAVSTRQSFTSSRAMQKTKYLLTRRAKSCIVSDYSDLLFFCRNSEHLSCCVVEPIAPCIYWWKKPR